MLEQLREKLDGLVLVHLLVYVTEVLIILSWLEALRVLTDDNLALLWLVLPKVEALSREHVSTNTLLEVLVRDEPIFVHVESGKDTLEVLWRDVHTPKV